MNQQTNKRLSFQGKCNLKSKQPQFFLSILSLSLMLCGRAATSDQRNPLMTNDRKSEKITRWNFGGRNEEEEDISVSS